MGILRDKFGTPILDVPFNICNGEIPGISTEDKFGRLLGLNNTEKTVWTGSIGYTFPGSAFSMQLASTSVADICSGGVTKAVWINYLNSSWDLVTEVHCLNGQTPIDINFPPLRSNRMKFLSSNITDINTGQIWLGNSGGFTSGVPSEKYGHIDSGVQQTYQAFYSVPRGYHIKIYDLLVSVNEGKSASVWYQARQNSEVFSGFSGLRNPFQHKSRYDIFQGVLPWQRKIPKFFPQMTDIEFRASGSAGGDVNLSVEWTHLLIGSEYLNRAE